MKSKVLKGCQTLPRGPSARSPSRLDGFLLSDVGIQANGMPLSVLSMMARMGINPWEEAECLLLLPNELAVYWIAAAIGRSSVYPCKQSDVTMLASRLIDRLHVYPHVNDPTPFTSVD